MGTLKLSQIKRLIRQAQRRIYDWKNRVFDPRPKFIVAVYHRVVPGALSNPMRTVISEERFIDQIDKLSYKYHVVGLMEALSGKAGEGSGSKMPMVLTFDDGYRDNFDFAFPVLKRKGLPATFFVATDYIGRNRPLWDMEVMTEVCRRSRLDAVPVNGVIMHKSPLQSSHAFAVSICRKMKASSLDEIGKTLSFLKKIADGKPGYDYSGDLCMGWKEICRMSHEGIDIGSHGSSHRSLAGIPIAEALQDIKLSKEAIEENTGKPCETFAFPFGGREDYNQALIDNLRGFGFKACALNIHGYNHISSDLFSVNRVIMDEFTDLDHLLG